MANVVNDIVKMEWSKEGWLQKKGKNGKSGDFIFGSMDYETDKCGKVSEFFATAETYLWMTGRGTAEQDIWNAQDLKLWCKDNLDGAFPTMYDEFVPLFNGEDFEINMDVIKEFGLEAHVDDIIARAKDIAPYGEESIQTLM